MKNGLFAARILSIIAILAFALPAFADTIDLTAAPNGSGPFSYGESSFSYMWSDGSWLGTINPSALVNGTEAFAVYGSTGITTSSAGTLFTFSSGWLSFSAGAKSGSGSLSDITFLRSATGVNTLNALFVGTVNGKAFTGHFNQMLAWNDGGPYWSGGPLGNGTLASPVPEPGTFGLLGTGLVFIAAMFRRGRLGQC